ncbi:MAG: extracellular solute-binding protein [Dethiobacter sp.]|nr:extracellular solute-binding protein [Dethiobacter sp.]
MEKINRRKFLKYSAFAGAGGAALLYLPSFLLGCAPREEQAKKELRLLLGSHLEFMHAWTADYEAKYGIKPSLEQITTMDLRNRLSAAFAARSSPWDAIFTSAEVIAPMGAQGWLKDLTERANASPLRTGGHTLVEEAAKSGHYFKQVVGIPIHIGCPIMLWNKKLMVERDLDPEAPALWHEQKNSYDTFLEYAKKMTFNKNGVKNYGFIDNWAGENLLWLYRALVQMHGGDLITDDEQPLMNSEACVVSLEKMVDLLHTHKCIDPASLTYTWVFDCAPSFLGGTRGVFITWPFLVGVAQGADSAIKGHVGFAPNFSVETSAHADGSEFLSIPTFAKHEEEAWKWIEMVTSFEFQKKMGETTGWFPIYQEVLLEPSVVANNPTAPAVLQSYQYPAENYITENYGRWASILADHMHRALNRSETPRDALNSAVKRIEEALR